MGNQTLSQLARTLGSVLEPVTGQVYFSPECHANYVALGFDPSPNEMNGVALPDGPAYFTSRGSVMGQVPGELVAAAFAVFNPQVVIPCVSLGWSRTDSTTICDARDRGAIAQLERLLGSEPEGVSEAAELLERAVDSLRPEGRPLFAGMRSLSMPSTVLGRVWRLGDMLREFRGDSHTAAWISSGIDATEIGLLSELYWGLPMRSYSRSRAWTAEQFDGALERLKSRGLVTDTGFTAEGREFRENIELATDVQMVTAVAALGDDISRLFAILEPWGAAIRAGKGYPASGPHDLAEASTKR